MFGKVSMNRAGRLHGLRPILYRPCAALVFAYGKERDQPQQFISLADEPHQATLLQSVARKELHRILITHLCQFGFNLGADSQRSSIVSRSNLVQTVPADGGVEIRTQR